MQGPNAAGPNADDGERLLNLLHATNPALRGKRLTRQELQWVRNIKRAFASDPELEPLSDFMVAQLALVSRGNAEDALFRAHGYQGFSEEYDIQDSVNLGVQCVQEFLEARPVGDFMYLSNTPLESPMFVSDLAKVQGFASRVRLRGYFYLLHASFSDLEQVRQGCVCLVDCKGFDWALNFGWKEYLAWWRELGGWYPSRTNDVRIFHTPSVANVMFAMGRKLMPAHERDRLKYGCTSAVGPLRNLYHQPTPEAARERILECVREGLERRYEVEASFRINL